MTQWLLSGQLAAVVANRLATLIFGVRADGVPRRPDGRGELASS
jgi:hypothetical protein